MLGWTPATYDAHNVLYTLLGTRNGKRGEVNNGGYSNPALDDLIDKIGVETDQAKRNADDPPVDRNPAERRGVNPAASTGHRLGRKEECGTGAAGGQFLPVPVRPGEVTPEPEQGGAIRLALASLALRPILTRSMGRGNGQWRFSSSAALGSLVFGSSRC